MFLYGAIACVLIAGVISETDTGNPLPVPTVNFHGRRTVRRSAPQLTAISEKDIFRSADDEPKRIYRQADLSYASYGGTPPWNYGNQQEKENSHGGQPSHPSSGYYPTQGGNGQQPGT